MITFSKQHDWQADPAVQQVLVFPNEKIKNSFDQKMVRRREECVANGHPENEASDCDAGAIYKLRGVMQSDGKWQAIIRCGFTGHLLWEDPRPYDDAKTALHTCIAHLRWEILTNLVNDFHAALK
jgi:hypothetical protein